MTPQAFYDYITKQMTPSQALLLLLESAIQRYEHLKFDEDKEVHPLLIMSMAAMDMGWGLIIEKDIEDVEGVITGTEEYVQRTIKALDHKPSAN